ncbi:MAG: TolC family protein [Acidobacteriia bacterium]|nr:TolC family protein [Terriglobia bacterium]
MNTKRVRTRVWMSAAALALFLFAGAARAQERENPAAGNSLTLGQAVRMALDKNPALRTAEDESDAARARSQQARAMWMPRVDFSQGFTRGDNPVYVFGTLLTQGRFTASNFALPALNQPGPLNNHQTRLDTQWRLFDSGVTLFRTRAARRMQTAAELETEQARQDLILRVVQAYYGVEVARENLAAATEAVRAAEASAQRLAGMHETGMVVESDYLGAKVFLAQMQDREIRARNGVELARMGLARETGMALNARPEPGETLGELAAMEKKSAEEWERIAAENRPALRAMALQEEAAAAGKKAVRSELGPKAGLFGGYERDALTMGGTAGTNWVAGARVEINLFAGGADRARMAEAAANANKAQHNLEWMRSGVMLEVRQAFLEEQAAEQRAAAARDAVTQSREGLRIVKNRYEAGLTNLTDLLRAQTAQLDAQTGYLAALHDWHVARAQLERSAGVLRLESQLLQGEKRP